MSQEDVLEILKELGGSATQKEIKDRAKSKYPDVWLCCVSKTYATGLALLQHYLTIATKP